MATIPSSLQSSSQIQLDYMKLLVTQLQNQNPLDPMNNQDMASQLAQFSSLSQLESLNKGTSNVDNSINSNFANVLSITNRTYANSLIGKDITFLTEFGEDSYKETVGAVIGVQIGADGETFLTIESNDVEYALGLNGIVSINNDSINSNFSNVLSTSNRTYANSLIGKDITFYTGARAEDNSLEKASGTVNGVEIDSTGVSFLRVGSGDDEHKLRLNEVVSINN